MIQFSEFMDTLIAQVMQARAAADLRSVEMAELYSKHEILSEQEAPRFKIASVEFDVPLVVADVNVAQEQAVALGQAISFSIQQTIEEWLVENTNVMVQTVIEVDQLAGIHQFAAQLNTAQQNTMSSLPTDTISEVDELIGQHIQELVQEVLEHNGLDTWARLEDPQGKLPAKIGADLKGKLKTRIPIKQKQLNKFTINPLTNALENLKSEQSLLRVKVKMQEDGAILSREIDDQGNVRKTLV